ncbi:MAG: type II toxin-antitoxin system VapC family toxin [Limisphaerales bacterium]
MRKRILENVVAGHTVVASELAVTEVRSALLAKERAGRISAPVRHAGWRLFQKKVRDEQFVLLPPSRRIIERAGGLIEQCRPRVALRTLEAIHLATAELCGGGEMCGSDHQVVNASHFIGPAFVPALTIY